MILKIAQFRRIFWQIPSSCGGIILPHTPGSNQYWISVVASQNSASLLKVQLCSHLNTSVTHWDPINGVSITTPYRGIRASTHSAHRGVHGSSRMFFFLFFSFLFVFFYFILKKFLWSNFLLFQKIDIITTIFFIVITFFLLRDNNKRLCQTTLYIHTHSQIFWKVFGVLHHMTFYHLN